VNDFTETVTGLASTGVDLIIALSSPPRKGTGKVAPGHPIVPLIHVGIQSEAGKTDSSWEKSTDIILSKQADATNGDEWMAQLTSLISKVASRQLKPKAFKSVMFNITRGPTGVST
jgi:hypothetical protein